MTTTVHPEATLDGYRALRGATGLVDYTGAALISVAGPQAATFLSRVCTRSVDFLLEGQLSTVLLLADDGTVRAEALVHCKGTEYLVEVWPEQADAARAALASQAADTAGVTLADVSADLAVYGIEGPESFKIIQKFLEFPVASMAYRSFVDVEHGSTPLMISRAGITGEYGYKLYVAAADAADLHAELLALGARAAGRDAVDICRMETRFINLECESGGEPAAPFQLGLQWMVDANLDFVGKQALFDRWRDGTTPLPVCWAGAPGETTVPPSGTPVSAGSTDVGRVTHALFSPALDRVIGIAQVDRTVAASGLDLAVGDSPATTVSAPFLVATSFGIPLE